jgi:hypothetical protein
MSEYSRREWLHLSGQSGAYVQVWIDNEGDSELLIHDGQDVVSLFQFGDLETVGQKNLAALTTLIDVLVDFRSAYQDTVHPDSITR